MSHHYVFTVVNLYYIGHVHLDMNFLGGPERTIIILNLQKERKVSKYNLPGVLKFVVWFYKEH